MKVGIAITAVLVLACGVVPQAGHQIKPPAKRATIPAPPEFPQLSVDAEQLTPQTIEVVSPAGRQTIVRTRERVLVINGQQEWLFERNPLDSRRASAVVVEHGSRALVLYGESDLRNVLGLNGWADVLISTSYDDAKTRDAKVIRVEQSIDVNLLQDPTKRFPAYKVFDLADWLEHR